MALPRVAAARLKGGADKKTKLLCIPGQALYLRRRRKCASKEMHSEPKRR